jgi:hypothetical protein
MEPNIFKKQHRIHVPMCIVQCLHGTTETREGWPLLTGETEANGDSKSTHERGSALVG